MRKRWNRWRADRRRAKHVRNVQGYHDRYHFYDSDTITFYSCKRWPCDHEAKVLQLLRKNA